MKTIEDYWGLGLGLGLFYFKFFHKSRIFLW